MFRFHTGYNMSEREIDRNANMWAWKKAERERTLAHFTPPIDLWSRTAEVPHQFESNTTYSANPYIADEIPARSLEAVFLISEAATLCLDNPDCRLQEGYRLFCFDS